MTKNYFTDEQVFNLAKEAGLEESADYGKFLNHISIAQLKALMNLAVEAAIGAPVVTIKINDVGNKSIGLDDLFTMPIGTSFYSVKELDN